VTGRNLPKEPEVMSCRFDPATCHRRGGTYHDRGGRVRQGKYPLLCIVVIVSLMIFLTSHAEHLLNVAVVPWQLSYAWTSFCIFLSMFSHFFGFRFFRKYFCLKASKRCLLHC